MADSHELDTTIVSADISLEGPIYDDVHAHLTLEVRDFYAEGRTLVIRTWLEGHPVTTMVSLDKFTDAFDGMRAQMMVQNWDVSLAQLTEGGL